MEIGQAIRRANGRVGGKPRVLRGIVKAFRRPNAFDRAQGLRCLASPRHALLAESLGKPSLWVIINGPWYKGFAERRRHREGCAVGYMQSKV